MKPESEKFVQQAHIILARADTMLSVGLNEDAARGAYLASFHAAQAYIFEISDKTAKTHHGVQREFLRLTKDDTRADRVLRRFLSQSYEFKSVADYFSGVNPITSSDDAVEAVATAKRFVAHVAELIAVPDGSRPTDAPAGKEAGAAPPIASAR